jgi:hypothetical protein
MYTRFGSENFETTLDTWAYTKMVFRKCEVRSAMSGYGLMAALCERCDKLSDFTEIRYIL